MYGKLVNQSHIFEMGSPIEMIVDKNGSQATPLNPVV